MKKLIILFVLALFLGGISALCEEGQININTATAEELDEIIHVGLAVAGYIIGGRSFESLDDLVEINYISLNYVEDIKQQGLACVDKETKEIEEEKEEIEDKKIIEEEEKTIEEEEIIEDEEKQEPEVIYNKEADKKENIELDTIKLNAKSIKRENDNENPDKSNYAMYGFVIFCILLGVLFILKKKKNYKTEFERYEE